MLASSMSGFIRNGKLVLSYHYTSFVNISITNELHVKAGTFCIGAPDVQFLARAKSMID
jgi:hypothetical protein